MTDYQVLCICVSVVVIVFIISFAVVVGERYNFMNYKLIDKYEYEEINKRLSKIEGCVKALLKKKSEL